MKNKVGRKKGSYSFVVVSMAALNRVVGADGWAIVSRKFADSRGIASQPLFNKSSPTEIREEKIPVRENSDAPLVNVEDWSS